MKKVISVCGSDVGDEDLSEYALKVAEDVGRLIAKKGAVLACGGHDGIMKAACKGAKKEKGVTLGIMPHSKDEANEFVDIAIPTNLGNIRNFLVVNSGDAVIAIGGRWGTLNEISHAMISGKKVILIRGTGGVVDDIIKNSLLQNIESNYFIVDSADEAIEKAFEI